MKTTMLFVMLLTACLTTACPNAIPVEGTEAHLVCSLNDCSSWDAALVREEIEDFRLHHVELFDNTFVEPEMIFVDDWLACNCGGYAIGTEVHVLGQVDGIILLIQETALAHEMTHNNLRRLTGNGDSNHAEPNGPWTEDHDLLIRVMVADNNRVVVPAGE